MRSKEIAVAGAGFAGSVMARQLADAGNRVRVIEQRDHIGGNAFDFFNAEGLLVHRYGPHIFHTQSERIFDYLSRFTRWRFYEHRVRASIGGIEYPFPINRTTVNQVFGCDLQQGEVDAFLATQRIHRQPLNTSEDVVLATVGKTLGDLFYAGYTQKQWGCPLAALNASVVARVPWRDNDDERYFTDHFQYMPCDGYHVLFSRLLDHPNIAVELNTPFDRASQSHFRHIVYTGPIDAWFDYCYGKLPYRSLRFEHLSLPQVERYQSVGTINYPLEHAYTRITEFKHLTGQHCPGTALVREYPSDEGPPFYPVPSPVNDALYARYRQLSRREPGVTFVGRLAQYRYYNMDQVVAAALKKSQRLIEGGMSWTSISLSSARAG